MNFTDSYIEKVSKAKEIQTLWDCNKLPMHDWMYFFDKGEQKYKVRLFTGRHGNLFYYHEIGKGHSSYLKYFCIENDQVNFFNQFVWLPTLEDLFEMIKTVFVVNDFYNLKMWLETITNKEIIKSDIKEIVFDYVMNMVFEKQWNSDKKEWEVIE